ncbi:MAG: 3-deoxy-7-phosphoheptulonate synthase [Clostridia bacterium]|nr:3-deoxy-7-phosphoheptulonate synthase [Clostridia bacterium]
MNMNFITKLPDYEEVQKQYPLSREKAQIVADRNRSVAQIFNGETSLFLLIIGPCSADNEDSVLDYISRLRRVQEKVCDKILIIPRIYTNKPRTTGEGYKGMLHQPDPSEKPDMLKGIIAIRQLHMKTLVETGFTCADEMLYPENHRYLEDLLAYVAVGARSVENQQHRLTASGINIPVGMKNPTSGDITVMMNSIKAAQQGHTFIYRGWEVRSEGNPYAHAVLRGYVDKRGVAHPNYHYEDLLNLYEAYSESGLKNPSIVVDTNHSNSGKKPFEQVRISKEVLHSMRHNQDIGKMVKGLMIESYIEDGAQCVGENIYGKSITDPCLGWEKTERLIYELADIL